MGMRGSYRLWVNTIMSHSAFAIDTKMIVPQEKAPAVMVGAFDQGERELQAVKLLLSGIERRYYLLISLRDSRRN